MPTKHVTHQIEAYLDQQLSASQRRVVEEHLTVCSTCSQHLFAAQRLASQLGPTLKAVLGRPLPPPALRYRVRQTVNDSTVTPRSWFLGLVSGRVLNGVGTAAVIVLLALGAFVVVQSQLPGSSIFLLRPGESNSVTVSVAASTPTIAPLVDVTAPSTARPTSSAGDTLPSPTQPGNKTTTVLATQKPEAATARQPVAADHTSSPQSTEPKLPAGKIAFSFFNPAPDRQVYEIHLINPDGANHRLFPLDGVSEPALRHTEDGLILAFRAWSEPTTPRSLQSSHLDGEYISDLVGGFWEDAQPDWSPTEDRLIFASQRESDRRWRLYTIWGDGLAEKELRREGQSPSFAPDGYQFVFEGCDNTGNRCGLWIGNLDNSEYNSRPLLEEPLARSPDWSPVDSQIAYMANPDGNWDLFIVASDGTGGVRRLTTNPAIDGLPTWSPDGQWLAFLSNRDGNWGIWLLHLPSGEVRRIFSFDGGTFTPPQRDPYGQRNWQDEQLSWSR